MEKKCTIWLLAVIVGLAAAGITACSAVEKRQETVKETATVPDESDPGETTQTQSVGNNPSLKEPEADIPVQIFYGDGDVELILSKEMLARDVNQDELVRCLTEAGVLEEGVQVLSLELREDKKGIYLDVDFNEKFTEKLNRMGTSGERIYMGSVVNTFLTAFEADFMMVTAEGKTIESGHVIYDEYQGPYEQRAKTSF